MKVSIVGVGRVGSALGLVLVSRQLVQELVLVGRTRVKTEAEALDLSHAAALGRPTHVYAGDLADTADSDVVVIALGAPLTNDDRSQAACENYQAFCDVLPTLAEVSPSAVLLVATNPVDAMTTLAARLTGLPPERVLGTGTLVDTMRLRAALSARLGIHPLDIRAYVLGEHGDSQFAAFSCASAGGGHIALSDDDADGLAAAVRKAGYDIYRGKGYTSHGIALATAAIVEAILCDSQEVMPLSVLIDGFAGVHDVCLSLPVVVGRRGASRRIDVHLSNDEIAAFQRSAEKVREVVMKCETEWATLISTDWTSRHGDHQLL